MRALAVVAALALVASCRAPAASAPNPRPSPAPERAPVTFGRSGPVAAARQLVVVTTPAWDSTSGTLVRFDRAARSGAWRPAGAPIPIVVGRTGLAWGVGFDSLALDGAPHKHEGDGRSPAGAFPLDTVFGFAPADSARWVRMPYAPLLATSECVDDSASVHYNTVVNRDAVPRVDWRSAEPMREIWQYRQGVIVGYNSVTAPPARGRGSCIFLHVWAGPGSVTTGCTAMEAVALAQLTAWLDDRKQPMLVQLPAAEYERLRTAWELPPLPPATTRSSAP